MTCSLEALLVRVSPNSDLRSPGTSLGDGTEVRGWRGKGAMHLPGSTEPWQ